MARRSLTLVVALLSLWPGRLPAQDAPTARSRSIVGELIRVDLEHSRVTLKTADKEPREYELEVDAATRFVWQGRALKLEDLRVGERAVAVVSEDERGRRRASLVKLGASAYAVPQASKPPRL